MSRQTPVDADGIAIQPKGVYRCVDGFVAMPPDGGEQQVWGEGHVLRGDHPAVKTWPHQFRLDGELNLAGGR